MNNNLNNFINRRDFLKSGLRSGILGIIVFSSGILCWRKIKSADNENYCQLELPCRNCSKLNKCDDLKAKKFIQNKNQLD